MAVIAPVLRCTRLDTNVLYATSVQGDITTWTIDKTLDAPAKVHLEIAGLGTFASALVNATGGPALNLPIIPLLCEFSEDGGATVDIRFVLTSCMRQLDPTTGTGAALLVIDQDDLSALLTVSGVDRITVVQARPGDVLDGTPGSVPRPPGAIGANKTWPYVKGLDKNTLGLGVWAGQSLLQQTFGADPAINSLPLSVDIWADMLANGLKTIATRLAGTWQTTDLAPFGARAHWVGHSGDAARSSLGATRVIRVGRAGTKIAVTYDGSTSGPWDETTTARIAGPVTIDPALGQMYAQASMIGGISNHGIDNGQSTSGGPATNITCGLAINTGRGPTSHRWDDNLPILGTTAGVYYYPFAGFLVPMSQGMVINALAYNPTTNTLYAATNTGVFTAPATPPPFTQMGANPPPWTRLGGLAAPVADVWMDGQTLLARCGGETKKNGQGIDGIYQYPALAGDTSGNGQGYAGWSRIAHSGAPLAAGGTATHLYYTDKNKPGTVYLIQPGTSTPPQPIVGIPSGQNVVAINTGINVDGSQNGFVYLLTDSGAAGIYSVAVGTNTAIYAGFGIVSDDGALVQVKQIRAYGAAISGEFVALLAATGAGLFRTATPTGTTWSAPNATSGLGDFSLNFVFAGTGHTVLNRQVWPIYAGAERSFLVSRDAGDTYRELLSDKLDCGPFWAELARQCGGLGMPWPDNSVGGLGNVPGAAGSVQNNIELIGHGPPGGAIPLPGNLSPSGSTDTGGSGIVLPIPAGNPRALPAGWLWARRLDEQNQFAYRLVNLTSTAPLAGMQYHELAELQANAQVGPIAASEQVALVVWRWLAAASVPRFSIPLLSGYTTTMAKLRDVIPTDLVGVAFAPTGWTTMANLATNLYVQRHTRVGGVTSNGAGYVATTTTVGNTLETANLDPNAMAAAEADRLTKKILFGSA